MTNQHKMEKPRYFSEFMADFGDGTYKFRLSMDGMRELESKFDLGPVTLYRALSLDNYRIDYIVETVRVALIGGGMSPANALQLVRRYVTEAHITDVVPVAVMAVGAFLWGVRADGKLDVATAD